MNKLTPSRGMGTLVPMNIFLPIFALLLVAFSIQAADPAPKYPLHQNIIATIFWVGEPASADNKNIANITSAWDDAWQEHFGGFDDPKNRTGHNPAKFTPKENPFYFALPYNDFKSGKRRVDAKEVVPWAGEKQWGKTESMCKNHWIKITRGEKTCYAQWEDVGPFKTDDADYVFGTAQPKNKSNKHAGLDLSPAAANYLGVTGMDPVDWQFIDAADVPDGPWKKTVTTSQITWK